MAINQEQETTEVVETNQVQDGGNVRRQTVRTSDSADGKLVARRIIWYIADAIMALLALRVVLLLLGANRTNVFVDVIYSISSVFAAPFFGIFNYQPAYEQSTLEVSSIVAIAVYALVALGLAKLFTLTSREAEV